MSLFYKAKKKYFLSVLEYQKTKKQRYRNAVGNILTITPNKAVEQMLPTETYKDDRITVANELVAQYKLKPQMPTNNKPKTIRGKIYNLYIFL